MTSLKGVGIPVKLLHEAEGHVVTVELKTGEMYRGQLHQAEDNWNVQLKDVSATARDGKVSQARGSGGVAGREAGGGAGGNGRGARCGGARPRWRPPPSRPLPHAPQPSPSLLPEPRRAPAPPPPKNTRQLAHMYIRGSRIRFVVVPDMLKNAPMFKRIDPKYKNKAHPMGAGGRGRAAAAAARSKATR
jgi:small nuclear ribonucleoprotein (snRNP)-like protein